MIIIIIFFFFFSKNNMSNQYSMTISVISNDINVIFFKNNRVNQFESLMKICLYRPTMLFLSTENSKSYEVYYIIIKMDQRVAIIRQSEAVHRSLRAHVA
jgi:hypothetical protein